MLSEKVEKNPESNPNSKRKQIDTPIQAEEETLDGDPSIFSVESKKGSDAKPNMKSVQEPVINTSSRNNFQRRKSGSIEQPNGDLKHFGESIGMSNSSQNM